jgi:hypothetical protein
MARTSWRGPITGSKKNRSQRLDAQFKNHVRQRVDAIKNETGQVPPTMVVQEIVQILICRRLTGLELRSFFATVFLFSAS